jgi:hypothetical protein
VQGQRARLGRRRFLLGEVAVAQHALEDLVAAPAGVLGVDQRRVTRGGARQPGDDRHLADIEVPHVLREVAPRGRLHAVGARPEEDVVHVDGKDLLLRVAALETAGDDGLTGLALEGLLRPEEQLLGDLLGDGRAALGPVTGGEVAPHRAADALEVDAAVIEEVVVFRRDERQDELLGSFS